jgi:tight adherence protein C
MRSIRKNELLNNYSFAQAFQDFSRRCGLREVSVFATAVVLNDRRGGEEFAASLKEQSKELWDRRKALVRTLGEEASAKLAFPMVLVFLVVMVIVAAPAILIMNP